MLAAVEVPGEADQLHERVGALAQQLLLEIEGSARLVRVRAETDLLATEDAWVAIVRDGAFKLTCGEKLVRFYTAGDVVLTGPRAALAGFRLEAVFGGELLCWSSSGLSEVLAGSPALVSTWLEMEHVERDLMAVLASAYVQDEVTPSIDLVHYDAGESIIECGAPARHIYLLVSGEAMAEVDGVEVGAIGSGEFFGEVSFFTETSRTASVVALSDCTVQRIGRDDFRRLLRVRPQIGMEVAKSLSRRVVSLNEKLKAALDT